MGENTLIQAVSQGESESRAAVVYQMFQNKLFKATTPVPALSTDKAEKAEKPAAPEKVEEKQSLLPITNSDTFLKFMVDKKSNDIRDAKTDTTVEVSEEYREAEENQQQGLGLKKPEEKETLVILDRFSQFPIAPILDGVMPHHAPPKMDAQPKTPDHHHQSDEILPDWFTISKDAVKECHRSKSKGPRNINNPCIAHAHGNFPNDHHQEAGTGQCQKKKIGRIHFSFAMQIFGTGRSL